MATFEPPTWQELAELAGVPTTDPRVVQLLKATRKKFGGVRADLKPHGITLEEAGGTVARVTLWAIASAHAGLYAHELPLGIPRDLDAEALSSLPHPIATRGPDVNGTLRDATITQSGITFTLTFDVFAGSKNRGALTSVGMSR